MWATSFSKEVQEGYKGKNISLLSVYSANFSKGIYFTNYFCKWGFFSNYFLHGVIFYIKAMQIAKGIDKFRLRVTHGTGLASATSDLSSMGLASLTGKLRLFRIGNCKWDWRVTIPWDCSALCTSMSRDHRLQLPC